MARTLLSNSQDLSERPLADYFWIAGLDSQDLLDAYKCHSQEQDAFLVTENTSSRPIEGAIEEDTTAEDHAPSFADSPSVSTKHSRQNSYQKWSRPSERRSSTQTLDKLTHLPSIRSNATVRRVASSSRQSPVPASPGLPSPGTGARESKLLDDVDFDKILKRFTDDRDAFYLDLSFKSPAVTAKSSKPLHRQNQRTQRIVAEEMETIHLPNRALGSVRRHMSFKDMNSTRRQPSLARKYSTRSAKRVSSYNSVMPAPQPLHTCSNEHPIKRSFEPVLLDRYPRPTMTDHIRRRDPFPDYVPMFAFPNDIHIISSDTRPSAKWHEFFLTGADNMKTSAVCVIIWIPVDRRVADDIEKRCEEWRKAHMTEAERELAASLGERLAAERAKLSRLLARLPSAESGTEMREKLEDEIGIVEEKIALMSDMLKPLRHGAASRIEGLTDGDSGLWIPRAYGILGRDQSMVSFWKEWLKAIVVPMMDGAVLRVPPSSPRVGMWQPLERYVSTICNQAFLPLLAKAQVEVVIRELRLYAKREARNELPGSRTVDLYPFFRCLTIPNIMVLFEYLLAESRIILTSAYASVLKLASNALLSLLWPLEWTGVHIPVVPTRLMEVLEAPIPYICGVVRKNDNLNLPQDNDFVMVDLDKNELHATAHPPPLPKQHRRKLMSMLYLAAPHHQTRGVTTGPPAYAYEAFPYDMFVSEHPSIFSPITTRSDLGRLASLSSAQFGQYAAANNPSRTPVFNAFASAKPRSATGMERPQTASTARRPSQTEDSDQTSPATATFPQLPTTPQSRKDSGFALQASLREKRAGQFDTKSRNSPSLSNIRRKASLPFVKHAANSSQISDGPIFTGTSTYASSTYAQSTLAASTVMPGMPYQPVENTTTTTWAEGHCMQRRPSVTGATCSICAERSDGEIYKCSDCSVLAHSRCIPQICLPCPAAFYPEQIRVAFARFFTSFFHNYRRFMFPADADQKKGGVREKLSVDAWIRTLPPEHAEYMEMLRQTQAFDGFVHECETKTAATDDKIALFDALMAARKARSKGVRSSIAVSLSGRNPFAGRSHSGGVPAEYLSDTTSHVWRVVQTPHSAERADLGPGGKGREYRRVISRTPAKLEDDLFPPPSMPQAVKRDDGRSGTKKSFRHRMNGLSMHAP